jgi:hypothetical protein
VHVEADDIGEMVRVQEAGDAIVVGAEMDGDPAVPVVAIGLTLIVERHKEQYDLSTGSGSSN